MDPLELVGFVTGAWCVWLAARENVWTFPVGIVNNVVFAALFATTGLYAGAGLQLVYLVLGALGWWWWMRGGAGGSALVVRATPRWVWPVVVLAVLVSGALLAAALMRWTDSTVPVWDGVTTGMSLVAQTMLGRKLVGNWVVWIVTDVLLIGLYASQGLWLTAALYAVFIGLCVSGLRRWTAALRAPANGSADEVALVGGPRAGTDGRPG